MPQEINFDPFFTVRESLRHPAGLLRPPPRRGARGRGARPRSTSRRKKDALDARALGRHEAPAAHRQGAGAPPEARLPRRAHRRRGRGAAPRPVDLRAQARRRGHHHRPHHPLPRGGRGAGRPGGHHQRGAPAAGGGQGRRCCAASARSRLRRHLRPRPWPSCPRPAAACNATLSEDRRTLTYIEREGSAPAGELLRALYAAGLARSPTWRRGARAWRTCSSKSCAAAPRRPPEPLPARTDAMNTLGMKTLFAKEVRRFLRVPGQTVLSPLISTTLYFVVFGYSLGGRVRARWRACRTCPSSSRASSSSASPTTPSSTASSLALHHQDSGHGGGPAGGAAGARRS